MRFLFCGLFVEVFGEGEDTDSEFAGFDQFGIIGFGVHAQDDSINIGCDLLREPPCFGGHKSV
jgi:hypothetical protein